MPPEIPSVYDAHGTLLATGAFDVVERASDGTVTIASACEQPVSVSRIRYAGIDHPGFPIPVQKGHKIVIPAKPTTRVIAVGDVVRNGQKVQE
jgi:hypothetical protein